MKSQRFRAESFDLNPRMGRRIWTKEFPGELF